jgi:hypothetical protein
LALSNNTTGSYNTATGESALRANDTGNFDTASGAWALGFNRSSYNTATGASALLFNNNRYNTAIGMEALTYSTGTYNIGLGYDAGYQLTVGNNNIEIANMGTAADTKTIRVGTQGTQTATYIAGVSGAPVTGADVMVNSSGRLGVVLSSAHYKRDIRDMGDASAGLMKLRPVTFRYKDDPHGLRQYGLVAEEVERVYPELVTYGQDGKVETARYSMLTSILLNELQRQSAENGRQTEQIVKLSTQAGELKTDQERQHVLLEQRLATLERALAAADGNGKLSALFQR